MDIPIKNGELFQSIKDTKRAVKMISKATKISKDKIIEILKEEKDDKIYDSLRQEYHSSTVREKNLKKRARSFAFKVKRLLSKIPYQNGTIVDIGCADGSIVYHLGKELNFKKIIGVDFDLWLEKDYTEQRYNIDFIKTDGNSYKIPSNSVDIVLCSNSIHHMQNFEECLKEISRIMKKGALLIIKDHDCQDEARANLLDLWHALYGMVKTKDPQPNFISEYYARYFSKEELREKVEDIGFRYRKSESSKGLLCSYLSIFEKI